MNRTLWKLERLKIKRKLDEHPLVARYNHTYTGLGEYFFVRFTDGTYEVWESRQGTRFELDKPCYYYLTNAKMRLPRENAILDREIKIHKQFESIDGSYSELFSVPLKEYMRAGFINRRLFVHEFAQKLVDEGWVDLNYPLDELDNEYKAYLNDSDKRYRYTPNKIVMVNGERYRCRNLIEHFFPIKLFEGKGWRASLGEGWKSQRKLAIAVSNVMRKCYDINRSNVVREMANDRHLGYGPRIPNPTFWRAIIDRFAPDTESIRDVEPDWGGKALAASFFAADYYYDDFPYHEAFEELGNFVGANFKKYDNENCDLCILSDMPVNAETALNRITENIDKYDKCIIIVDHDSYNEVAGKFKPSRKLFFTCCSWLPSNPHHIILYQK